MLIDASRQFIQALEQKTALVPLYRKQPLIIEVIGKDNVFWLSISPEGHRCYTEAPSEKATLYLSGSDDQVIEQAIKGEHSLLNLKEKGALDLQGPFYQQLTLESLLILSGKQSFLIV